MIDIELRPAVPDDADAIADYHERCFRSTYAAQVLAGEFEPPDLVGTRDQLREWFEPGSELRTLVAVVDGAPVGHVTVWQHRLIHLFVTPDRHGTGLGRRLLERGESMLASAGHHDLELHVRVENVRAISFYQRAGWTMTDVVVHTVEHGIEYDEHVLVKQLTRP